MFFSSTAVHFETAALCMLKAFTSDDVAYGMFYIRRTYNDICKVNPNNIHNRAELYNLKSES